MHLFMLSWSSFNRAPNNILSKPLAAFPHNHCPNNRQRGERNESCRNDYNQSSERILAKSGIETNILKLCTLPTELWGWPENIVEKRIKCLCKSVDPSISKAYEEMCKKEEQSLTRQKTL